MRCALVPLLDEYLQSFEDKTCDYQKADCARLAGGWVKKVTGFDPLPQFGAWSNIAEAEAAIAKIGTLPDCVSRVLKPRDRVYARLGDIVACTTPTDRVTPLGICLGVQAVFLSPARGLVRIKTRNCDRAWSVDQPEVK